MPGMGSFAGECRRHEGYGKDLKDSIRNRYGANVGMAGRGEQIPNENTFCEIDPDVVDQFGIPVLRFHFQWTDAELKQAAHMHDTFKAILETMGGTVAPVTIHHRVDFAASMIDGRTVGEVVPNSQSAKEISDLWLYIQERLSRIVRDPGLLPEMASGTRASPVASAVIRIGASRSSEPRITSSGPNGSPSSSSRWR